MRCRNEYISVVLKLETKKFLEFWGILYIFVVLSKAPYEIGGQPWVKAPPGDGFSTDYSPPPNRGYLVTN